MKWFKPCIGLLAGVVTCLDVMGAPIAFRGAEPVNEFRLAGDPQRDADVAAESEDAYAIVFEEGETIRAVTRDGATTRIESWSTADVAGRRPAVAGDGQGSFMVVWSSTGPAATGTDRDLFFSVTTDYGENWTPAAALNSDAETDTGDDDFVHIASNGAGRWVAVWERADVDEADAGSDPEIVSSFSITLGSTWSAPVFVNDDALDPLEEYDTSPVVAHGDGTWVVGWIQDDAGDVSAARSMDGGATWQDHAVLTDGVTQSDAVDVDLVATPAGWTAVWSALTPAKGLGGDRDMFFSRTTDAGFAWETASLLNTNALTDSGEDRHPALAAQADGTLIAVWESDDGLYLYGPDEDIVYATSDDSGVSWSLPLAVNLNAGVDFGFGDFDTNPDVAALDGGGWLVVWESPFEHPDTDPGTENVFIARAETPPLTWSGPGLVSNAAVLDNDDDAMTDAAPDVAVGENGTMVAVWATTAAHAEFAGTDQDIFSVRSTDGGLTWSSPAGVWGAIRSDDGTDGAPAIATNGAGRWMTALESEFEGVTTAVVVASEDDGASWVNSAALIGLSMDDGATAFKPRIAADRDGDQVWIAVYERDGGDSDIYMNRTVNDGEIWSLTTPVADYMTTDMVTDSNPDIATDGEGTWMIVWSSVFDATGDSGADQDIFAVYSEDDGATWSAPVLVNNYLSDDNRMDTSPRVVHDGFNWYAAWASEDLTTGDRELSSGSSFDLSNWSFSRPITTGGPSDESTSHGRPSLAVDSGNTLFATWSSTMNIYPPGTGDRILYAEYRPIGGGWTANALPNEAHLEAGLAGLGQTPVLAIGPDDSGVILTISTADIQGAGPDSDLLAYRLGDGPYHSADTDESGTFSLSEVLRVIQLYNAARIGCSGATEDGYLPDGADEGCDPHTSDYSPQDWSIGLSELLRAIQLFNSGMLSYCGQTGEDGYCASSRK